MRALLLLVALVILIGIALVYTGTISLTQTREVIVGVRDYIEKLKDEQDARKRAKQ